MASEEELDEVNRMLREFMEKQGWEPDPNYDPAIEAATEEATYRAIGRFIKMFSSIERTMRMFLAEAVELNLEYVTPIITHDFALLCTAVKTVYLRLLKTDEERAILKQLISECRALNDLRVKVVHGEVWFPGHNGGTVAHVSRQTLELKDTSGMAERLEQAAAQSGRLFGDLHALLCLPMLYREDAQKAQQLKL